MDFKKIWKIYKDNVLFIDPEDFDHWWSLNWLERAQFDNDNINDGFICYKVEDNLHYSPKIAFGVNYIIGAMFSLMDVDTGENLDLCVEIYKVQELKDYFKGEYDDLINILEQAGVHALYNDAKTKICFYYEGAIDF